MDTYVKQNPSDNIYSFTRTSIMYCIICAFQMRVVMRRDQIHKVCANHYITPDIKVSYKEDDKEKKLLTWRALDFSDDEQNVEFFCCK